MGRHQRRSPWAVKVGGRQGLVEVGGTRVRTWALPVAGAPHAHARRPVPGRRVYAPESGFASTAATEGNAAVAVPIRRGPPTHPAFA